MCEDMDFNKFDEPIGTSHLADERDPENPKRRYVKWKGITASDREIEENNNLFLKRRRLADLKEMKSQFDREKQEEEMLKGTCDVCGAKNVVLKKSFGRMACVGCSIRREQIKKNKALAAAEFEEFHDTPAPGISIRVKELEEAAEKREKFVDFLARENKMLEFCSRSGAFSGYIDFLQQERERLEERVGILEIKGSGEKTRSQDEKAASDALFGTISDWGGKFSSGGFVPCPMPTVKDPAPPYSASSAVSGLATAYIFHDGEEFAKHLRGVSRILNTLERR